MPELDLDELERLHAAATPGPWEVDDCNNIRIAPKGRPLVATIHDDEDYLPRMADAQYITAACNSLPDLIKRVRELERQREFFLSTLKENNLCPAKGRCWSDGSELEEWDCSAVNNRECWIQAAKEAGE